MTRFDFLWVGTLAIGIATMVGLLVLILLTDARQQADRTACREICHPAVGQIINKTCHCATETGWERQAEEPTP